MAKSTPPVQSSSEQAKQGAAARQKAAGDAGVPLDAQPLSARAQALQAAEKKNRRSGELDRPEADPLEPSASTLSDGVSSDALQARATLPDAPLLDAEPGMASSAAGSDTVWLAQAGPAATATVDAAAGATTGAATGAVSGSAAGTGVAAAATASAAGAASWVWVLPAALAGAAVVSSSSTVADAGGVVSRIRVVDGPIEGAKVYVDLNDNGVVDANEPQVGETKAGDDGYASITLTADQAGHALLAKGGTDLATSKAFAGVLAAPKGSTVINPLTTLVAALMEGGSVNLATAQAAVKTALGITGVADLTSYDTFAEASKPGATADALAIHQKAVQIANIIVSGSAAVAGEGGSASAQLAGASNVIDFLASKIASSSGVVVFSDTVLTEVLTRAGATAGAAEAAKSIASVNSVVASATSLAQVAQAQVVAQFVLSNAIQNGNTGLISVLQDSSTAQNLSGSVSLVGADTTAPAAPVLALATGVADGASASEVALTSGVLTVSAESGALTTVTFSRGNQSVVKTLTGTGSAQPVTLSSEDMSKLGQGSISVSAVATDSAGNSSSAASSSFALDTAAPSLAITSSASALKAGETATITFTFSEEPTGFTGDDVVVSGGTLGALSGTGLTRTATFTPDTNKASGNASITVAAGSYTDAAGNTGAAGSTPALSMDTAAPTLAITSSASALKAGETATITFTFSEEPTGFTGDDVVVSGGTLGALSGTGLTRTATFTPDANKASGNASITVAAGSYTDAAGNTGLAGSTPALSIDTRAPTLAITSSASAVKVGQTATITFTFSEEPTGFTLDDVVVSGGTLGALSGTGLTRTATFTPDANKASGNASITVAAGSYTDAAGNAGAAGSTPALSMDTLSPESVGLALAAGASGGLTAAEALAGAVTVTGEAESSISLRFVNGDKFVTKSLTGTGSAQTVALTADDMATLGEGSIQVSARQTDAAGNFQTAGDANVSFSLDTVLPEIGAAGMSVNRSSRTLELTFSENLQNLDLDEQDFAVRTVIGGSQQANTVMSATVTGNKVTLLLASDFEAGMVNVEYKSLAAASAALVDEAGNQVQGVSSNKLADGYIRGASIFIQLSEPLTLSKAMVVPKGTTLPTGEVLENALATPAKTVLAAGDFFYTGIQSNAAGDFFLPSSLPKGAMVATGGVNVDTGVPNNVVMKAPVGANIINPLTTMVQAVMDKPNNTLTAEAASMTVASALGLPADLNMTAYDPIAAGSASGNDATALAVQKAAAQVATLVSLASGSNTVIGNLASQFTEAAQSGISVNLSDSSTLNSALAGVTVDADKQATMADAMSTISNSSSLSAITSAQAQVLDKVAPKAPTVQAATAEAAMVTKDSTPEVRIGLDIVSTDGSAAVVGDTLIMLVNGAQVATYTLTEADVARGYALASLPTLPEGSHSISARQIDAAGNASNAGDVAQIVIDQTAPQAALQAATVNATGTVQVQSSEPGRAYLVSEHLVVAGLSEADIQAAAADLWASVPLATANQATPMPVTGLADGAYRLMTVDAAGNLSAASTASVTVDNQAPLAAVGITSVVDDVEPEPGAVAKGGSSNDNTLLLSGIVVGSLAQGEVVQVYDGATLLGLASVDATAGTWSFATPPLGNGAHSFTARVVDAAGNLGQASSAHAVDVNASVPTGVVALTSATPALTNDSTPLISGTVTGDLGAGDQVVIYDGNTRLGAVPAAANWTFTVPDSAALAQGRHNLMAVLEGSGGNQGAPSAAFAMVIDTTAPTLTIQSDDSLLNIGDSATLTFVFSEAPLSGAPAVSATGASGASLGALVEQAGSGGRIFTAVLSAPATASAGSVTLNVPAWTDAAGNAGLTLASPGIAVDTQAPAVPTLATNFEGSINLAEKTAGARIEVSAAEADVVRLSIGSSTVVLGSGNASYAEGKWTYALTANDYAFIGKNNVKVSASATDAAGNSTASAEFTISADTVAPLLTPVTVEGVSAQSNRINTATPGLRFTAEVGATLAVDWNGSGVFQAVDSGTNVSAGLVQGSGSSSIVALTAPSAVGTDGQVNTVSVRATDAAGNVSVRSASYVLDSTAPSGRSIVVSQDGRQLTLSLSEPVAVADVTLSALSLNNGHSLGTAGNGAGVTALSAVGGLASSFVVTLGTDATMAFGDTLSLAQDKLSDVAGNKPAADIAFQVPEFDAAAPTLQIGTDKPSLRQGESAVLSFTFSEAVKGFDRSDIVVSPAGSLGTLSSPRFNDDGTVTYTIAYRPAPGTDATVKVSVDANRFTDLVGNAHAEMSSLSLVVDTIAPSVGISASAAALKAGSTATLTFTFSEAPASVPTVTPVLGTASGQAADAGSLGALTVDANNPKVYTATYTPPIGQAGGKVGFLIGSWSDAAGNAGLTGAAPLMEVDTLAPTLRMASSARVISASTSTQGGLPTLDLLFSETPATLPTITPSVPGVTLTPVPVAAGTGSASNKVSYFINVPAGLEEALSFAIGPWTDRQGNAGTGGTLPSLTVDTRAPQVSASITEVKSGADVIVAGTPTSAQTFTVSGAFTGPLGTDKLFLFDGATLLGEAVVTDQTWSLALSKPLANGAHSLSVIAQDAVGNRSAASPPFAFSVNAEVPQALASIVSARDDQGALQGPLSRNALTDDTTPRLVGFVQGALSAGDKVVVFKDGVRLEGFATLAAGGSWTFDVSGTAGASSYTASVINGDGVKGVVSAPFVLRTDASAPTLTMTASKSSLKMGEATVLSLTFSEPVAGFTKSDITGVAPESLGSLVGPMNNADGSVTFTIEYRPAGLEGKVTAAVLAGSYTDLVGNAGEAGSSELAVDTLAPNAPQINPIAGDGVINQAEARATAGVSVSGTAGGASKLALSIGGLVRELSVNAGAWSYRLTADDLAQLGQRSGVVVTARAIDEAGNTSAQLGSATLAVDTLAPVLKINGPIFGDGFLNDAEDEQNLVISGTTVDIANGNAVGISVGSLTGLSATVNNNVWSLALTPAQLKSLTPGAVQVSVSSSATDGAGNIAETSSRSFVYDRTAPSAPTISKLNDVSDARLTNSTAPTLTVTAEAGAKIVVGQNGVALPATAYTVSEASAGVYTVKINTPLAHGAYGVRAVDAAGNVSPGSTTGADIFRIDTVAPIITAVELSSSNTAAGVALVGDTLTLRFGASEALGSAPPQVSILDRAISGDALVLDGGKWRASYTVTKEDVKGEITPVGFSILATDAVGNTMPEPFTQARLPAEQQMPQVYAGAPQISASARIDWIQDSSLQFLLTGDQIVVGVHFSADVEVTGSPVLNLVLTNAQGQSKTVQAAYTGPALAPTDYLTFSYTVANSDGQSQYHIAGLGLPSGALIKEVGGAALPADLAFNAANKPFTAGSYIYGDFRPGTQGSEVNDVLQALPLADTMAFKGGSGDRDLLVVQIALPGVTDPALAKTYSLTVDPAAGVVKVLDGKGVAVPNIAAPYRFPEGIENLLFRLVYNTGTSEEPILAKAGGTLLLSANTAQYQDGMDYAVQGSLVADNLNVSSDTRTDSRYFIRGSTGNDTLTGHAGPDGIAGDAGNDLIAAGGGSDRIFWSNGVDTVDGGEGTDTLVLNLAGTNPLVMGRISGPALAGVSDVAGTTSNGPVPSYRFNVDDAGRLTVASFKDSAANITTATSIERVEMRMQDAPVRELGLVVAGSSAPDTLTASGNATSVLVGLAGNDVLTASSRGMDILMGGGGDDTLVGGTGPDFLYGGDGNDSITAGAGDDFMVGGPGNDRVDGGEGSFDALGFAVAGTGTGLATGAELYIAYDASLGGVAVKQGTRALVKITKDSASGAFLLSDLGSGTGYVNFGTDTVLNTEKFLFDYASNASGVGLTVDAVQINALLAANTAAPAPAAGSVSLVTKIDWTADESGSAILRQGDTLRVQAHFTNPVVVQGSPTLFLTIVDDSNASRVVQASLVSIGNDARSSLDFVYTLSAADKGRYHIGSIALNGGTIKEMLPGATAAGLPADLGLGASNLTLTAGSYLYGAPTAMGTAGNDLLNPFDADPSKVPTGINGTYPEPVPNGGEGTRDVLSLPVLLPSSVATAELASGYTLRYAPAGTLVNGVASTKPLVQAFAPNASAAAVTVPVDFPAGVEQLVFHLAYKDSSNTYRLDVDADDLRLSSSVATFQDPVLTTDRFVQGSLLSDTLDVSSDTLTTTRYALRGSVGNDLIKGHAGTDFIFGDGGNDNIQAGGGNDRIYMGPGQDLVDGGEGSDTLVMGVHGNQVVLETRISGLAVVGQTGMSFTQSGVTGFRVDPSKNDYALRIIGDGDSLLVRGYSSNTADITTATGIETIEIQGSQTDQRLTRTVFNGSAASETLSATGSSRSFVLGLGGDDVLNAGAPGSALFGGSGNDTLNGGAGLDAMWGGAGNDVINGGEEADFIVGGPGNDLIQGDGGSDAAGFSIKGAGTGVTGNLEYRLDTAQATAGDVLVFRGNLDLARIHRNANGSLTVTDLMASDNSTGVNYLSFGTDTLTGVEVLTFDYTGNTSDVSLTLTSDKLPAAVASNLSGTVINGYVAGATVFYDANNNGLKDSAEPSTLTSELGQYTLNFTSTDAGRLVALPGGMDSFSGKSLVSAMAAASGSTVISPLTTLISTGGVVYANKLTRVFGMEGVLGAAAVTDLGQFDPVAAMLSGNAAQVAAGTAVFTAQQAIMSVMQVASAMGLANYANVAAQINAAIDSRHASLGTAVPTALGTANFIVDTVIQQLTTDKVKAQIAALPSTTPEAVKSALLAQIPLLTPLIASPTKAALGQAIASLTNLGPNFAQGLNDLKEGVSSTAASALATAKASVGVAQDALLQTVAGIVAKATTFSVTPSVGTVSFPEMLSASSQSSNFVSGLNGLIGQSGTQLVADSPLLTQSFLRVQAGATKAFASNNTAVTTDDVSGSFTLTGSEKVSVFASPKAGGQLSAEQKTLVSNIKSAANAAAFHTAVKAAEAGGLNLSFNVALGNTADINGNGTPELGASARLDYSMPATVTASDITFVPVGDPVLKQSFVKLLAGQSDAFSPGPNPAIATDDVYGESPLSGSEKVMVYGQAKAGQILQTGEKTALISAILNAGSSDQLDAALKAAQVKLDLQFIVNAGARDINGDGTIDNNAANPLLYVGHSGGLVTFMGLSPFLTQGFFKVAPGQTGAHAEGARLIDKSDDVINGGVTLQGTEGAAMAVWAGPSDPAAGGVLTLEQQALVASLRLAGTPSAFDAAVLKARAAGVMLDFQARLASTADVNGGGADANSFAHLDYAGLDGVNLLFVGDSVKLSQSFLTLSPGLTGANGISGGTYVVGSYTVKAEDKAQLGVQAFPMDNPNAPLTTEQANLLKAVIKAADLAAFDTAVGNALDKGLDLKFNVNLGSSANIDGKPGNEIKGYALLNYLNPTQREGGAVFGVLPPDQSGPQTEPPLTSVSVEGGQGVLEGAAASFTVSTPTAVTSDKTLQWRVMPADNYIAVAQDFGTGVSTSLPSGTVTIATGAANATFSVQIFNDTLEELIEAYRVEVGYLDSANNDAFIKLADTPASIAASDTAPPPPPPPPPPPAGLVSTLDTTGTAGLSVVGGSSALTADAPLFLKVSVQDGENTYIKYLLLNALENPLASFAGDTFTVAKSALVVALNDLKDDPAHTVAGIQAFLNTDQDVTADAPVVLNGSLERSSSSVEIPGVYTVLPPSPPSPPSPPPAPSPAPAPAPAPQGPLAPSNGATLDSTGQFVTLNFAQALFEPSANLPTGLFVVKVGTTVQPVNAVEVNGSSVKLTLNSALETGTVTVSYTDPNLETDQTGGVLEYDDGSDVPTIGDTPTVRLSSAGSGGAGSSDTTAPSLTATDSAVLGTNGTTLTLSFNEPLQGATVQADKFAVTVDGLAVGLIGSTIAVNGTALTLTLALPAPQGAAVMVSYTDPDSDQTSGVLQDAAGNDVVSIVSREVTNNSTQTDSNGGGDGAPPQLEQGFVKVSSGLTAAFATGNNADPDDDKFGAYQLLGTEKVTVMGMPKTGVMLNMGEMESLIGAILAASDAAGFVSALTTAQARLDLKFVSALGDDVNIDGQTDSDAGAFAELVYQGNTANPAEIRFGAKDVFTPMLASSNGAVLGDNGTTLTLTFNEPLQGTAVPASLFAVTVGGQAASLSGSTVAVNGTAVTLTLAQPVPQGAVVALNYTDPSNNQTGGVLEDAAGNDVASIASLAVTNTSTQSSSNGGGSGGTQLPEQGPLLYSPPMGVPYSSALVNGANTIRLTYSEPLQAGDSIPNSRFAVWVNGKSVSVTNVSVGTNTVNSTPVGLVTLTTAESIPAGADVYFTYADPDPFSDQSSGVLQSATGGRDVSTKGGTYVDNPGTFTGSDALAPAVLTVTENVGKSPWIFVQGNQLFIQFTESLNLFKSGLNGPELDSTKLPLASLFNVSLGTNAINVTEVSAEPGNKSMLKLTLVSSPSLNDLDVKALMVKYTVPPTNAEPPLAALQDMSGNKVAADAGGVTVRIGTDQPDTLTGSNFQDLLTGFSGADVFSFAQISTGSPVTLTNPNALTFPNGLDKVLDFGLGDILQLPQGRTQQTSLQTNFDQVYKAMRGTFDDNTKVFTPSNANPATAPHMLVVFDENSTMGQISERAVLLNLVNPSMGFNFDTAGEVRGVI